MATSAQTTLYDQLIQISKLAKECASLRDNTNYTHKEKRLKKNGIEDQQRQVLFSILSSDEYKSLSMEDKLCVGDWDSVGFVNLVHKLEPKKQYEEPEPGVQILSELTDDAAGTGESDAHM
jgi:hypothetical protein